MPFGVEVNFGYVGSFGVSCMFIHTYAHWIRFTWASSNLASVANIRVHFWLLKFKCLGKV